MENFWKNEEWLKKTKETDYELYEKILDGKNIEMEWESLSLVIDDSIIPLTLKATENGSK